MALQTALDTTKCKQPEPDSLTNWRIDIIVFKPRNHLRLAAGSATAHRNIIVIQHRDLVDREKELARKLYNLSTQSQQLAERTESLGLADALLRRALSLIPRFEALGRRIDALERLASALSRRIDALEQRCDAFKSRITFYLRMYQEHHKTKKNNNEPCTTRSHKY